MKFARKLGFVLAMALTFGVASNSLAAEDAPEIRLQKTIAEVIDVLYIDEADANLVEKRERILEIMDRSFSFDIMIGYALGRNKKLLNEEQMESITILTTDLLVRSFTKEFKNASRPVMSFSEPTELTKNKIEVSSKVKIEDTEVQLAYRLARLKTGWQVYDILVEGVSMVSNYRKQFQEHFQKKNAEDLIEILKERINKA